ncbi:hypothetical protein [Brevundimonas nasdae]
MKSPVYTTRLAEVPTVRA